MASVLTENLNRLKTLGIIKSPKGNREGVLKSFSYTGDVTLRFYHYYHGRFEEVLTKDEVVVWLNQLMNVSIEKDNFMEEEYEKNRNNYDTLRDLLFDTIRGVKDGTVTPEQAKGISMLSQSIINSVRSELEARKYLEKKGTSKMLELND